jgi:hypothetical protein
VRFVMFASLVQGLFLMYGFYSWQRYFLDLLGRSVWVHVIAPWAPRRSRQRVVGPLGRRTAIAARPHDGRGTTTVVGAAHPEFWSVRLIRLALPGHPHRRINDRIPRRARHDHLADAPSDAENQPHWPHVDGGPDLAACRRGLAQAPPLGRRGGAGAAGPAPERPGTGATPTGRPGLPGQFSSGATCRAASARPGSALLRAELETGAEQRSPPAARRIG